MNSQKEDEPKITITTVALHRSGVNPVYGEGVTYLKLCDDGGGFFLEVSQIDEEREHCLRLDPHEITILAAYAKKLVKKIDLGNA